MKRQYAFMFAMGLVLAALFVQIASVRGRLESDREHSSADIAQIARRVLAVEQPTVAQLRTRIDAALRTCAADRVCAQQFREIGPPGLRGRRGPRGPRGLTGPQGTQGAQGVRGPAGRSLRGPRGPQGARGPQGPQGQRGPRGPLGPLGPVGPVGPLPDPQSIVDDVCAVSALC